MKNVVVKFFKILTVLLFITSCKKKSEVIEGFWTGQYENYKYELKVKNFKYTLIRHEVNETIQKGDVYKNGDTYYILQEDGEKTFLYIVEDNVLMFKPEKIKVDIQVVCLVKFNKVDK